MQCKRSIDAPQRMSAGTIANNRQQRDRKITTLCVIVPSVPTLTLAFSMMKKASNSVDDNEAGVSVSFRSCSVPATIVFIMFRYLAMNAVPLLRLLATSKR
jgi:hypothetical protein